MSSIKVGDLIGIPCQVSEGPFEDEQLVEFDTMDGKVSGFTTSNNVSEINSQTYVRGGRVRSTGPPCGHGGRFLLLNERPSQCQFSQPLPMAA